MNDNEIDSIEERPTHGLRFLMCDPTGKLDELSSSFNCPFYLNPRLKS
jgi:hypothetical protein